MSDFNVGFVKKFKKVIAEGGNLLLTLKYADIEKLNIPRSRWNKSTLENTLIWIAGGGSYIINNTYLVLVKRSPTAQSNPGKLTIQTGLSDSEEEWKNPSLLKRELFEEVIILDHDSQNFYFPDCDVASEHIIRTTLKGTEFSEYHGVPIESEWLTSIEKDQVIVQSEGENLIAKGLLHFNENNLNILYCCKINQSLPLEKINFFDAEFTMVNGKKKFLNREIYFYDLINKRVLDTSFQAASTYEFTEHAKYLIETLENNWR